MQLVPRPQRNGFHYDSSGQGLSYDRLSMEGIHPGLLSDHSHAQKNICSEQVVVFIDGSNLFYAALQLGIEIDYFKLLQLLTQGRRLVRAYFYTGVDPTNEKQQGFLLWMSRNGYRVISKDLIQMPDGSRKANLDVEIAIDMISLVGSYDTAVLVSGDGDLSYAVNAVSYKGVCVEIVSLYSMTSDALLNVADKYIDLTQIQAQISKNVPQENNGSPTR